jgi:photosystem II stability/assembly factor-like uncharacterized protein
MKISPDSDIDNVRRLNPSALAVDQAPPPVDRALLARIVSQPRDEVLPNTPGTEHHRWRIPLGAVAAIGAVLAVLPLVLAPWSSAPTANASSWHLVNLNGAQFRDLGTVEGLPKLQCVTNRVCYAPGYGPTSLIRGAIYRTVDGGAHWRPSAPVPQAVDSHTASLECTTASFCFFKVGTSDGIVLTTSGGASWASLPLPATPGKTDGVWCANSLRCLVSESSLGTVTAFAVTSDGGKHWSTQPAPAEAGDPWYFTCDSSGRCLEVELGGAESDSLTAMTSDSWGGPWVAEAPQSIGRVAILYTSCADATHCMFVGLSSGYEIITTSNAGRTWTVSRPPHGWQNIATAVECSDVERCWVATASYGTNNPDGAYSHPTIEATSNLGRTWSSESIANTRPAIADVLTLSCPPSGDGCIGLGNGKDHFVLPANRQQALSNPIILSNLPNG